MIVWLSLAVSIGAYFGCNILIPPLSKQLLKAGISGHDVHKPSKPVLPESLGLAPGFIYLLSLLVLMACHLLLIFKWPWLVPGWSIVQAYLEPHSYVNDRVLKVLAQWCAALLSVQSMLVLGFADDVLDVRWKHKVALPAIAAIPLVIIYRLTGGVTCVRLPWPVREWFLDSDGQSLRLIDLGPLYYVWMAGVAVFGTHSINILAGVNGLEVGQCLFLAAYSCFSALVDTHDLSMTRGLDHPQTLAQSFQPLLLIPFIGVSFSILRFNWCPARVFVGDVFCYFGGMTLAVAAILGHATKTLVLLMGMQAANFVYSLPQLFKLVPCPRHRMPVLIEKTDEVSEDKDDEGAQLIHNQKKKQTSLLLTFSTVTFDKRQVHNWTLFLLQNLAKLKLIYYKQDFKKATEDNDGQVSETTLITISNMTLINLCLWLNGPCTEAECVQKLLKVQVAWCTIALLIRHPIADFFYKTVKSDL